MKFLVNRKNVAIALGAMLCVACGSLVTVAQETSDEKIEIVNQDGEKVQDLKIELRVPQAQGEAQAQAKGGARIAIKDGEGKIIVVDKDGNQREIDVSGAQSIIVNQSVQSVVEDGEEKRQAFGKAIIVGPDGQRQEFELAPGQMGPAGKGLFRWNQVQADRVENSYMIGVNCSPVSDLVSKQLRLETGTGLVVDRVSDESPAASAGLEQHDILMFANDQQLYKLKDLTEIVQASGKDKEAISLTLLRSGKEISIDVTPVKRPASAFAGHPGMRAFVVPHGNNFDMQFRQLGPGIIMGPEIHQQMQQDMEEQMKAMREQMEQLRNDMRKQFEGKEGFPQPQKKEVEDF